MRALRDGAILEQASFLVNNKITDNINVIRYFVIFLLLVICYDVRTISMRRQHEQDH